MRLLALAAAALFTIAPVFANAQDVQIFDAMQDEMARSMKNLRQDNFAKPYYMSYTVFDINTNQFKADKGSLLATASSQAFDTDIMMRVGNSKEDNSYFENNVLSTASIQWPANGYDALRFALWEGTDQIYKNSLSQLAKKQAYKKSKNVTEDYGDFSPAKTSTSYENQQSIDIDQSYWQDMAKALSARGQLPELDEFSATITITRRPTYFLSSEGAKYFKDDTLATITLFAAAKTTDGFELKDTKRLSYAAIKDIPSKEDLLLKAADFAAQTAALATSPKADPYIGPVLLEKSAAASLFDTMFKRNIENTRQILSNSYDKDSSAGEFAQKKGLKIMPVNFNVIDDPLLQTFGGIKLAGYYTVDDEGVSSQKLLLVKNGKLNDLPTTRSLIKGQKKSNGHARAGYGNAQVFARAGVGNLMFLPHATIPEQDFKAQFISYCKEEGLDYCYIIKDSLDGSIISAYKIDAKTGEQTPVHGATITGITTRTLRDIKFAADDLTAYNYPGYRSYGYSIIAPSVILSEIEIKPAQKVPVRKPLVAKP